MINGAHAILYSTNGDADRAFFRDVLKLTHVDVGHGWLIFGLPPSELAVHPSESNGMHQLYLMCDDIEGFVAEMQNHGIAATTRQNQGWGIVTEITLPGGSKLGVYQPMHARPNPMGIPAVGGAKKSAAKKAPASKAAKKAAPKKASAKKAAPPKAAAKKAAPKKTSASKPAAKKSTGKGAKKR